jgi:hypothetical protein
MPYYVIYKNSKRNWGQHTLGDFIPGLDEKHERILDALEEGKWQLKQERYRKLKANNAIELPPLRRGRKLIPYPSKKTFHIDVPRDLTEIKRFPWFTKAWAQNRNLAIPFSMKGQTTLDGYLTGPKVSLLRERLTKVSVPHFRMPRYTQKEEYCGFMTDWAWEACHAPTKKAGLVSHLFYLNSFEFFDESAFLDEIRWQRNTLPSDIIKFEIHRLLQGFESYNDYFRMYEMSPILMDPPAINMTHSPPSAHHFTERLKQIGLPRIQSYFNRLVTEARRVGLIRDFIHVWDGQFHKTWLQNDHPRKVGLAPFFGGTYNHGGAKVGVGVYQSTIMDWNGYCTIPIYTHIVPANRNENPVLRETVLQAYGSSQGNPLPSYFLADRGPSGFKTQQQIWNFGSIPIIPLRETVTSGVRITQDKKHRFYRQFVGEIPDNVLIRLYAIRTRIEEHYHLNDSVYKMAHLHCAGEILTKIENLLVNSLGVLIPLTAFKIGRPDLMWSPTSFRSHLIHPERVFPIHYRELEKCRWDETIVTSPQRYHYEWE